MNGLLVGGRWCLGVLLSLAAGHASAEVGAPAAFDQQNSFLLMTPAQLYRLDPATLSADGAHDRRTGSNHTKLMLGWKASPSVYGALVADHSSAGRRSGFGADGAFKILDQLVVGAGLRRSQEHGFDAANRDALRTAEFSEAALMKGDTFEGGVAFWQLLLRQGRDSHAQLLRTALVHGRWLPTATMAFGVQARLAPQLLDAPINAEAAAFRERWLYAVTGEYAVGDWKGELLYSQPPRPSNAIRAQRHGAALLYYRVTPAWTVDGRLEGDFSSGNQLSRVAAASWYGDLNGPTAPSSVGLGCAYTL